MPPEPLTPPPGLHGAALKNWEANEERRRAGAALKAQVEALARAVGAVAAQQSGQAAPDALRSLLGRDGALRVLALAGHDAEQIGGNWQASEPIRQQASTVRADYSGDPDHDPRVVDLLMSGAGWEEITAVRQEVAAGYAAAAAARRAPDRRVLPVPMGVSSGEDGVPYQRSVVAADWSQFPDHGEEFLARHGAVTPSACDHAGQNGRHCTACGAQMKEAATQ